MTTTKTQRINENPTAAYHELITNTKQDKAFKRLLNKNMPKDQPYTTKAAQIAAKQALIELLNNGTI